jgi:hypothetical protein
MGIVMMARSRHFGGPVPAGETYWPSQQVPVVDQFQLPIDGPDFAHKSQGVRGVISIEESPNGRALLGKFVRGPQ